MNLEPGRFAPRNPLPTGPPTSVSASLMDEHPRAWCRGMSRKDKQASPPENIGRGNIRRGSQTRPAREASLAGLHRELLRAAERLSALGCGLDARPASNTYEIGGNKVPVVDACREYAGLMRALVAPIENASLREPNHPGERGLL